MRCKSISSPLNIMSCAFIILRASLYISSIHLPHSNEVGFKDITNRFRVSHVANTTRCVFAEYHSIAVVEQSLAMSGSRVAQSLLHEAYRYQAIRPDAADVQEHFPGNHRVKVACEKFARVCTALPVGSEYCITLLYEAEWSPGHFAFDRGFAIRIAAYSSVRTALDARLLLVRP